MEFSDRTIFREGFGEIVKALKKQNEILEKQNEILHNMNINISELDL